MGLSYLKKAGIGAWVGPSDKATAEERNIIKYLILILLSLIQEETLL